MTFQRSQVRKLQDGLIRLESTAVGQAIAAVIRERGTSVHFGRSNAIAHFNANENEIIIHESLQERSPSVLAAHLAHEGTHVQWDRENSIDQKYHAFQAQAEVWHHLKGNETDEQCDTVNWMMSLTESEAKAIIRFNYPGLPETA